MRKSSDSSQNGWKKSKRTGKNGKSGIGLALTKEIVLLHNGKIRAYNGVSGAVFELQLPKK